MNRRYDYEKIQDRRDYVARRKENRTEWCDICHVMDCQLVIHRDKYTNEILGLLCRPHLSGLYSFQDDLTLVEAAVAYLRRVAYPEVIPERIDPPTGS